MGGIVARHAVTRMGEASVPAIITMSTPHVQVQQVSHLWQTTKSRHLSYHRCHCKQLCERFNSWQPCKPSASCPRLQSLIFVRALASASFLLSRRIWTSMCPITHRFVIMTVTTRSKARHDASEDQSRPIPNLDNIPEEIINIIVEHMR